MFKNHQTSTQMLHSQNMYSPHNTCFHSKTAGSCFLALKTVNQSWCAFHDANQQAHITCLEQMITQKVLFWNSECIIGPNLTVYVYIISQIIFLKYSFLIFNNMKLLFCSVEGVYSSSWFGFKTHPISTEQTYSGMYNNITTNYFVMYFSPTYTPVLNKIPVSL